jgi:CubicO group peptidase (beta-lactamase class C family)
MLAEVLSRSIFSLVLLLPSAGCAMGHLLGEGAKPSVAAPAPIDIKPLDQMSAAIRDGQYGNIHGVLVGRRSGIVYQSYFIGHDRVWQRGDVGEIAFTADSHHDVRSISKSVVSTLIGIAIAEGHIPSVDASLATLLPRYAHLLSGDKKSLTLKHVLTMTAGLRWDEASAPLVEADNDEIGMFRSADPAAFVLERELVAPPGATFNYNGGLTQLLAIILEARTGIALEEYAELKLFDPLGIKNAEWHGDLGGVPAAGSGLRLRMSDLGKLALLYANNGRWNGRQLIPEAWLDEATRPHVEVFSGEPDDPVSVAYGYQWWLVDLPTTHDPVKMIQAAGNGGQNILILPTLDLVFITFAGIYGQADQSVFAEELLEKFIIPALTIDSLRAGS